MPRYAISLFAGICLLVCAGPFVTASSKKDQETLIEERLAVQKARMLGESFLIQGNPAKAVSVLEAELARIDGDRKYLRVLRDAYQAYVRNLYLSNQKKTAAKYVRRLRILDPKAADQFAYQPEAGLTTAGTSTRTAPEMNPAPIEFRPAKGRSLPPIDKKKATNPYLPKIRANIRVENADPFSLDHAIERKSIVSRTRLAEQIVQRAEEKFRLRHYEEARLMYRKAWLTSSGAVKSSVDRWAYCKLNHVVTELNRGVVKAPLLAKLEEKTRSAMTMSPRLSAPGKMLLSQITRRTKSGSAGVYREDSGRELKIQHLGSSGKGWRIAQTKNFRVFHRQTQDLAERVAQTAERTRAAMLEKWFGASAVRWRQRCDVYLHKTARDYSQATGVSERSPGHSRIETDRGSGTVVSLRIDLHCDVTDMIDAVLPHETTHVVLAGQYGKHAVPRWVDEGIAVLSEPKRKIEHHLQNLSNFAGNRQRFGLKELMELRDYPKPQRINVFYAQSVSLVKFLSRRRGPRVFSQFVRDGLRNGYASSLRRHYGLQDFRALQTAWSAAALD